MSSRYIWLNPEFTNDFLRMYAKDVERLFRTNYEEPWEGKNPGRLYVDALRTERMRFLTKPLLKKGLMRKLKKKHTEHGVFVFNQYESSVRQIIHDFVEWLYNSGNEMTQSEITP